MSDVEIIESEVTVRLTVDGKLPPTITCSFCGGSMHRLVTRRTPTYHCSECDVVTILELSPEQRARGLK